MDQKWNEAQSGIGLKFPATTRDTDDKFNGKYKSDTKRALWRSCGADPLKE